MVIRLEPDKILETAKRLRARVRERFPEAGLLKIASDLVGIAEHAVARLEMIKRPNVPLRFGVVVLIASVVGVLVSFVATHPLLDGTVTTESAESVTTKGFVEILEPSLGSVFFIGAAIYFLISLEGRLKRDRALRATHELRVLAHIIDMHQLTKDPERMLVAGEATESSPHHAMTPFELGRYLDYCSEMLSINSKIAALYAQSLSDPIALGAVDQVESLTAGLSRKIWQKLLILEQFSARQVRRVDDQIG